MSEQYTIIAWADEKAILGYPRFTDTNSLAMMAETLAGSLHYDGDNSTVNYMALPGFWEMDEKNILLFNPEDGQTLFAPWLFGNPLEFQP